jgi:hypothetical protein
MPFSFHVDETTGILHVEAIGEVNDAELIDVSARLRREPAFIRGYPILSDCSALTAVLVSSTLIEALARGARSRTNPVAVIAPCTVAFGLARMYQIFCDPDEARIQVFAGASEAMAWLQTRAGGLKRSA